MVGLLIAAAVSMTSSLVGTRFLINWLRNRNTLEFLGIWERLNNPAFKPVEFDGFEQQAGLNSFMTLIGGKP